MSIFHGHRFLSTQLLWLLIGLLILSTALYTVGITVERGVEKSNTFVVQPQPVEGEPGHSEAGEASSGAANSSQADAVHQEAVLGINLESPGFITTAILGAVLLIVLLLFFQRLALWLVILFSISAILLDLLEVITQINRANLGIAFLALLVLAAHLSLAVAAGVAVNKIRMG